MQKNDRLENEVRKLRGMLEEQQNTIDQLQKDAENHYNDLDQRLQLLQQKVDGDESNPDETQNTDESSLPANKPSSESKPAVASPANPVNDTSSSSPTSTSSKNTETSSTLQKPTSEKDAYTLALEAYKQGGAKQAITPMKDFIKNYPSSVYIGNAHFWLAEFYLAVEPPNYNEAKKNYDIVAKQFPKSQKAPRALYQLYSIAKNIDHNNVSANLYQQQLLNKYPKSEEAGFVKPATKS
ncbi:MAG: YbgF trimerization domain-containing protein [Acinetobacter sp.]